jgi:hypothetical protein
MMYATDRAASSEAEARGEDGTTAAAMAGIASTETACTAAALGCTALEEVPFTCLAVGTTAAAAAAAFLRVFSASSAFALASAP